MESCAIAYDEGVEACGDGGRIFEEFEGHTLCGFEDIEFGESSCPWDACPWFEVSEHANIVAHIRVFDEDESPDIESGKDDLGSEYDISEVESDLDGVQRSEFAFVEVDNPSGSIGPSS